MYSLINAVLDEWTTAEKREFEEALRRHGKDFTFISRLVRRNFLQQNFLEELFIPRFMKII